MNALLSDDSPRALANALTTYNIVVEGVLAETGYHYYRQIAEMQGIFPGLLEGIRLIARDESRHLRFGIYMLQRLIAADDAIFPLVQARVEELRPFAMGLQEDSRKQYIANAEAELGELPEDLVALVDMISTENREFARRAVDSRLAVLSRARGQSPTAIERAPLEEDLETAMAVAS